MNYWNATNEYLQRNDTPTCPDCGQKMFPSDDHGNFVCFCNPGASTNVVTGISTPSTIIPQIDTSGMTDEEKEKITAVNRINDTPTEAEAEELSKMLGVWGPPT